MKVGAISKKMLFLNPGADLQIQIGARRVNVRRVVWKKDKGGKIIKIVLKN